MADNTPRRSTLAEARAARLARFRYFAQPRRKQCPTTRELGTLDPSQWQRQFTAQLGRCADCDMKMTARRRLLANQHQQLVCAKCWWGKGNVAVCNK